MAPATVRPGKSRLQPALPSSRSRRSLPAAALVTVALLLTACSSSKANVTSSQIGSGCRTATGGAVTITAKNSKWDTSCIKVSGTSVTFTIDNEDHGILHNLDVERAPGDHKTELAPGPGTQTLTVKGLTPGKTYTYICDLHANMVGELQVQK